MLQEFEVKDFKKFSSLKLENLGDVNILLGRNNVGKTTMLEALYAYACGENINHMIGISLLRANKINGPYDFSEKLLNGFYNKHTSPFSFSISGTEEKGDQHTFVHTLTPSSIFKDLKPNLEGSIIPHRNNLSRQVGMEGGYVSQAIPHIQIGEWSTSYNDHKAIDVEITVPSFIDGIADQSVKFHRNGRFVDILSHRDENENRKIYALLKREGLMKRFTEEISKTFSDVHGIDMLPYPDGSIGPVSVETDRGYIPLSAFGDGLQRYFHVIGGLFLYQNGIHCIEEVDATFHPEAQESFSRSLMVYADATNNQVFMSSHSVEFVDHFLESISTTLGESGLEKVRVITLKNIDKNEVRVRTLTGTEALTRRKYYEMELR